MSTADDRIRLPGMPFTVRLTLDGIRHQVQVALGDYDGQIRQTIEDQLKAVIEHYDFAAEVRRAAESVLAETIRREVQSALSSALGGSELRRMVQEAACKALGGK